MLSSFAFLIAALILAVTPGPGIAYVVARTAAGGRVEGLASCVGTGVAGLLHVGAAALGLSALLAQSAVAFSIVKYLGAAYLAYLGIRLEALKTALFFLAFLPQFLIGRTRRLGSHSSALACM